ncbi:MAG: tail fiber domain-containing protein [Microcystis panniformis]
MLTRVPEEIRQAEKAIDFEEYASQEPLKFQFYYGDKSQAEIINTIYLEDGNESLTLYLEVFNDSEQDVFFKAPSSVAAKLATVQAGGAQAASEKKCHFQLRWEKDLGLKPSEIEIDDKSGQWQVNYDEEFRFFSMYFLHQSGLTLKPNEKIQIGFSKLTANNRTVKSSNVELLYGGIGLISTGTVNELIEEQVSSKNAVSVINHLRKTQIPLQFRVLGSNAILNDGTTQNTLKLKVLNSPLSNNTRPILLLNQSSKFIVSFEQGDYPDALVATPSQLNNVQIQVTDTNSWKPEHTANSTQWSFTPTASLKQLTAGQGIELTISNLVTSSASGLACIYIDYQNIGSYPDGRLVIPIEKTPLLYRGSQVGIGTKTFDRETTKLKVNGDIVLGKDAQNARFIFHTRVDQSGDFLQITHDKNDNNWDWGQGITLKRGGDVGIGTDKPQAKLHVNGGDAVISGKVGIGITNPAAKLHVNGGNAVISGSVGIGITYPAAKLHVDGGDAVISGKVAIRTTNPQIDLAIGDNDTGLKQQGDNELAICTNGIERVRVTRNGTVSIGPCAGFISFDRLLIRSTQYHQFGGTLRLIGNGPNSEGARLSFGNRDEVYLTENEDKKLLIHADNQITLDSGSVGIGTTTPKAKLDVEGSVKFGVGGTIVNRMVCGQIYYNTKLKKWQYSVTPGVRVTYIESGSFKIHYDQFKVAHRQDLAIFVTVMDQYADNTICVKEVEKHYCLIGIRDFSSKNYESTNVSFMIIHFDRHPQSLERFSDVEGGNMQVNSPPFSNYFQE